MAEKWQNGLLAVPEEISASSFFTDVAILRKESGTPYRQQEQLCYNPGPFRSDYSIQQPTIGKELLLLITPREAELTSQCSA